MTWERLDWDTEFFGIPIGRAHLAGLGVEEIAAIEADAAAAGIECLYASLDPTHLVTCDAAQRVGWRFMDAATLFDLAVSEPPIPEPPDTEFRVGTADDLDDVRELVRLMAPWTRYAADPRFGLEAAVRLQDAWLDRAVSPDAPDHSIVLAFQGGEVCAFIGRVDEPGRRRVDAVGTTRRGSGAARFLIEGARAWAGDQALLGGPIMARNIAALRYVSHCAYRVCEVTYQLHRWLDED
jgi:hypothetical protein